MKMPQQEQEQIIFEYDHYSVLLELDLSTESSCDQIYQQLSQAARQCRTTTTTTITNMSTATCMVSVRIHDGATDTDDDHDDDDDEDGSNKKQPRRRRNRQQRRHGRSRLHRRGRRSSSLDQDHDDCDDDDDDDDDARPCGSDKLLQILMHHPFRTCVQELSLFNLEEESIAVSLLCQLLPALPNLKTLLLDNVMLEEDDDWMPDDATATTELPKLNTASLTCCGPAEDPFLQWLIAASKTSLAHLSLCQMLLSKQTLEYHVPQLHRLHALTLAHIPGLYHSNLCHCMGASGRMQLRQLVLRNPIPVPLWTSKMCGGLRQLSSLQSLTLSVQVSLSSCACPTTTRFLEWERVWAHLDGLSQLSSLTLQVVGDEVQQQSNKRSQWWWSSFVTTLASFLRHDKTVQSLDIVFPKQWDFAVEEPLLLDSDDNHDDSGVHHDDGSIPIQPATFDSPANNEDYDGGFFWRPLEQVLAHDNTVLRNFTVTFGSGDGGGSSLGSFVKPMSGWLALDHEDDDDSIHYDSMPDERRRTIQISPLVEYYLALNRAGRHEWRQRGVQWTIQQGLDHLVKAQQCVGPLDDHGSQKQQQQQQQQYCFELSMLFHFLSTHPSIMVL